MNEIDIKVNKWVKNLRNKFGNYDTLMFATKIHNMCPCGILRKHCNHCEYDEGLNYDGQVRQGCIDAKKWMIVPFDLKIKIIEKILGKE